MDEKELKKEWAKKKREAVEIAGMIHDIVEDAVWTKAQELPALSAKLVLAVEEANAFKSQHDLG